MNASLCSACTIFAAAPLCSACQTRKDGGESLTPMPSFQIPIAATARECAKCTGRPGEKFCRRCIASAQPRRRRDDWNDPPPIDPPRVRSFRAYPGMFIR